MAINHPITSYLNFQINKQITNQKITSTITKNKPNFKHLISCSSLNSSNVLLFEAAKHTVDTYVQSGMVVGLGSGVASSMAIEYLGHKLRVGLLNDVVGIPTSIGSASEAEKAGITLHQQYEDTPHIDFAFNDADIMEERSLNAVIRRQTLQGGESMLEEKKILDTTQNLVLMVTQKQYKSAVEGSIPVFVESVSWLNTAEEIDDLFVGDAEVWRRPAIGHADPTGGNYPLITREGHNVLDVIFTSPIPNLVEVAELLKTIDGVVDHGIITKTPCTAVIVTESGLCIIENTLSGDISSL
ncbi:probable ribose-5-phosphate isomerase 4, chloroplastic [Rutidosis leptorrhynchoides]|uniref:probable ribose-5-phosphate isomerase 4, chloroplastic n=1 Tax=Rutidosis leptorrhynchoides TaxID=125765 RepID=UPI003A99DF7A